MAIDQAFNETIAYYDDWIRKAVPGYDDLFAIARELIPFPPDAVIDVLDLGAGTGLFASLVHKNCPRGRFVLVDVAEQMLGLARERFRKHADRFRFVVEDYRTFESAERFDLVISSLSIHHLADGEKEALFSRIYGLLRPGGRFINVDQIKGPTPELQQLYGDIWLERVRRSGATEEQIRGGMERRAAYDREATLADQLRWLQEAGFTDVDCIYKNYLMGLFLAAKSAV